jgi:uncharacterized protein YndB with AHSA1/START domain
MNVFQARAVIRAKKEDVWGVFTDPRTWEEWYGGALLSVEPAWQAGAKLNWKMGPPSPVLEVVPLDRVVLGGGGFKTTWRFSDKGGDTLVEMEKDFRGGTLVVTDPSAQQRMADEEVAGLEKYVEKSFPAHAGSRAGTTSKAERKWHQFWK